MDHSFSARPESLLEQPVVDASGETLGRVGAVGHRHGTIRRLGIEHHHQLRFVAFDQVRVEPDRVVVAF